MRPARTVVVTGAGSGIGRAAALLFGAGGDRVSCWDVDVTGAERTAAGIVAAGGEAQAVHCDVAHEADVVAAFAKVEASLGDAEVLFINAGVEGPLAQVPDIELQDFRRVVDVNLVGAFLLAKHGIPQLRRRGGGSIVMTASILAHVASRNWGAYAATKGGLLALARSLAVDHADDGIRVNCVAPAGVRTELMHRGLLTAGLDDQAALDYEASLPTPETVAEAVHFLASPAASLVNGASLMLDNGLTITCPT